MARLLAEPSAGVPPLRSESRTGYVAGLGSAEGLAGAWLDAWAASGRDDDLTFEDAYAVMTAVIGAEVGEAPHTASVDLRVPESVPIVGFERLACLRDLLVDRVAESFDGEVALSVTKHVDAMIDAVVRSAAEAEALRLELDAMTDPLTGVWNRRALTRDLQRELARSQRAGTEVTVVIIDLDGLKAINDTQGHVAGDAAIVSLAQAFSSELRATDAIYRMGGDEFIVMLPDTQADAIHVLIDRVSPSAPAFSIGIATAPTDATTVRALIDAADQRLVRLRRETRFGATPGALRPVPTLAVDDNLELIQVSAVTAARSFSAEVTLGAGGRTVKGSADGPPMPTSVPLIVARATLDALGKLHAETEHWFAESAATTTVAGESVALVSLLLPDDDRAHLVTGTAAVRRGEADAFARATLDAVAAWTRRIRSVR